jgi:hypothetical protein
MATFSKISKINASLESQRIALVNHPVYEDIRTLDDLRIFMEHHVYAVWDFMSLLKSLQRQITGSSIPWLPSGNTAATRLINEIVLGEESDEMTDGQFSSHFEMYLQSMLDCGASLSPISDFLNLLRNGVPVRDAIAEINAPTSVQTFVSSTFSTIESNQTVRIAAAFTFGREDLLPAIFEKIVDRLNLRNDGKLDNFRYYLNRHIELDAEQHGPMAERMIASLCGDSAVNWHMAELAAKDALQARQCMWDGMHQQIKTVAVNQRSLRLQS